MNKSHRNQLALLAFGAAALTGSASASSTYELRLPATFAIKHAPVQPAPEPELPPANPVTLALGTSALPDATVGAYFDFDFRSLLSIGGDDPPALDDISWSAGASVPTWLTLNPASGIAGGTPTGAEDASLEVVATYGSVEARQTYTLRSVVSAVGDGVSKTGACQKGAATGCATLAKAMASDSSTFLSNSGQTLNLKDPYRRGGHGTKFVSSGKWYAELKFAGSLSDHWIGILDSAYQANYPAIYPSTTTKPGSKNVAWLGAAGLLLVGEVGGGAIQKPSVGDTLGIALNLDAGTVTLYRNCSAVRTVTLPAGAVGYAPIAVMTNSSGTTTATLNAGQATFTCAVPAGFNAGWW